MVLEISKENPKKICKNAIRSSVTAVAPSPRTAACDLTAGEQATWHEGGDGCHLGIEERPPDLEVAVEEGRLTTISGRGRAMDAGNHPPMKKSSTSPKNGMDRWSSKDHRGIA
jgi:hypothetical protein